MQWKEHGLENKVACVVFRSSAEMIRHFAIHSHSHSHILTHR